MPPGWTATGDTSHFRPVTGNTALPAQAVSCVDLGSSKLLPMGFVVWIQAIAMPANSSSGLFSLEYFYSPILPHRCRCPLTTDFQFDSDPSLLFTLHCPA